MKLRTKLLIAFLGMSILPFAIIGMIALFTFRTALSNLALQAASEQAAHVQDAAQELADLAGQLRQLVKQFRI